MFSLEVAASISYTHAGPCSSSPFEQCWSTPICSRPSVATKATFSRAMTGAEPVRAGAASGRGPLMPEGGETGLHLVLIGCAVERAGFSRQAMVEAGLRKLGTTAA